METYAKRCEARRRRLDEALQRFIAVCRGREDVRAVYVFGSLATGAVGPRSDLDLLVVRDTDVRGIERGADLAGDAAVGVSLDLIVVTPAEFRDRLPHTSFGRTLMATAENVYAA